MFENASGCLRSTDGRFVIDRGTVCSMGSNACDCKLIVTTKLGGNWVLLPADVTPITNGGIPGKTEVFWGIPSGIDAATGIGDAATGIGVGRRPLGLGQAGNLCLQPLDLLLSYSKTIGAFLANMSQGRTALHIIERLFQLLNDGQGRQDPFGFYGRFNVPGNFRICYTKFGVRILIDCRHERC